MISIGFIRPYFPHVFGISSGFDVFLLKLLSCNPAPTYEEYKS